MGGSVPHRKPRPGLGQIAADGKDESARQHHERRRGAVRGIRALAAHGQSTARHAPATATAAAVAAQLIVDQPSIVQRIYMSLAAVTAGRGGLYATA